MRKPLLMDRACDITPFADTESTRFALAAIFWDHEKNAFVATDSRVLAVVEPPERDDIHVDSDRPDRSVLIPIRAVKSALRDLRKSKKTKPLSSKVARQEVAVISANGEAVAHIETESDSGTTKRSAIEVQGRFPRWSEVIADASGLPHAFTIDPKYLLKIAQYFVNNSSGDDHERGVVVRFSDSSSQVQFSGMANGRRAHIIAMPLAADSGPTIHNEMAASEKWKSPQKKSKKA